MAVAALTFHTTPAPAQMPRARVHLRGTSRIDANASRSGTKLVIQGNLVDDAARAVANEKVTLQVRSASGGHEPLALTGAAATGCSERSSPPTLERANTAVIKTDDVGRFCVRLVGSRHVS